MTAGVTSARVIETVVRDAQQRAQQQRNVVQTQQRQAATQAALTAIPGTAQAQPYDSPARRQAADEAMRAAGVPDDARHARSVSDLMNGVDPALAARSGGPIKAADKAPAKAPGRERTR